MMGFKVIPPVPGRSVVVAGGVAPAIVKSASNLTNPNSSVISQAFTGNVTTGDLVVVALWAFLGGSAPASVTAAMCTKTAGTATIGTVVVDKQTNRQDGAAFNLAALFSVPVTGTGTLTMQCDVTSIFGGASCFQTMSVAEVSSVDVSVTRVNATASSNVTTGLAVVSGNVATGGAGIIFGLTATGSPYGTITLVEDGAFTLIAKSVDDTVENGSFIYRTSAANITDSADWTINTSSDWCAVAVAYKSSSP